MAEEVVAPVEAAAEGEGKTLVDSKYVDLKLQDGKIIVEVSFDAKEQIDKLAAKAENKYLKAALNALSDLL